MLRSSLFQFDDGKRVSFLNYIHWQRSSEPERSHHAWSFRSHTIVVIPASKKGPSSSKHVNNALIFIAIPSSLAVNVSSLCSRDRHAPLYKTVDGAVLTSESDNNLDCIITFQTRSILQRFMLRFERLSLGCRDHLVIFDGAHAIGLSKVVKQSAACLYRVLNFWSQN